MPEAAARMVAAMYKITKYRALVGPGMLEVFHINIALKQSSVLNPLLFFLGKE